MRGAAVNSDIARFHESGTAGREFAAAAS